MKIDNSLKATAGLPTSDTRTRASDKAGRTDAAQGGDNGKVQISSLSTSLQQMEETIAGTPVVDSARVNEIKQAITEGRFRVDTEKVADGLIQSVRQMLDAQTGQA
ncbi:flagellar biosynthesis anti-sigma factor FlgM [Zoogloea sp.]|uniref:flagellar biosynthesis anti-sigma factor FlgM n=1 Tax=Zoogloea sp. TaxID=49181 RepID=UPI0026298C4A|nr:flagellar biosynthesis anti-sigma factor FlgM [Zoogloea sp.]MDD3352776.1 flagellar biosynthesis anti-sigma factor FlgM [Zoogloea sp.]